MDQYLKLLRHVREHGTDKPQRAKVGGKCLQCRSVFAPDPMRFDLTAGFPLMTTKKIMRDHLM